MGNVQEQIREVFKLWSKEKSPGGQVYVRKNGEMIFEECFGYADIERDVKVTPDTIFHVASVSKQITCMCVLLLWEEGKINLDDDIRVYISDLISFKEPVTVRNMMNNISGIRDQWVLQTYSGVRMNDIITQNDLIYYNKRQKFLNFPPCSQYLYSNTNFVFLSEIVSRISGKSLNEFAAERIFKPLGMDKTFIRANYSDIVENRALSYIDMGDDSYKWLPLNFSNNGATSLHTTAQDFMKWLANFENPTICKAETIAEMIKVPKLTTDNETIYASGLMVEDKNGHKRIGHGGADSGYRAHVYHYPDDNLDIVALSNVENTPMAIAASKIADIVLGNSEPTEKATYKYFQKDSTNKPQVGKFCNIDFVMPCEIFEGKNGYFAKVANKTMPLIHVEGNQYACNYLSDRFYFTEEGPYYEMANTLYKMEPIKDAVFSDKELEELHGLYYSDEIESFYKIVAEGKTAKFIHKRYGSAEIKQINEEVYFCPLEKNLVFKLRRNCAGVIIGFTFMDARVLKLDFNKVSINYFN